MEWSSNGVLGTQMEPWESPGSSNGALGEPWELKWNGAQMESWELPRESKRRAEPAGLAQPRGAPDFCPDICPDILGAKPAGLERRSAHLSGHLSGHLSRHLSRHPWGDVVPTFRLPDLVSTSQASPGKLETPAGLRRPRHTLMTRRRDPNRRHPLRPSRQPLPWPEDLLCLGLLSLFSGAVRGRL